MKLRRILILTLVVLIPTLSFGQKRDNAPEDYYLLKNIGSPVISPDGTRAAFSVRTTREKQDDRINRIWVADLKSGDVYPFTSPDRNSTNPTWSKDGQYLIFNSTRKGGRTWHLDVKNGGEAFVKKGYKIYRNLSPNEKFSLGSKRTGMSPRPPKKELDKYDKTFDGKIITWTNYLRNNGPDGGWRNDTPDRGGFTQLFVIPVAAPKDTLWLTSGKAHKGNAAWTSDGNNIVYVSNPDQRDKFNRPASYSIDQTFGNEVFVVSKDGGTPKKLNMPKGNNGSLTSANKSNKFFFTNTPKKYGESYNYVYDLDNDTYFQFANEWVYGLGRRGMEWSPDDKYIYFNTQIGGASHLCRIEPAKGAKVEQVTKGAYRYGSFDFNEEMTQMVYVRTSAMEPWELFSADIDGSNEKQLTNFNKEMVDNVYIGKVTRHEITGIGGLKIEGWMVEPKDYDPSKSYPMVLQIHGGPHSSYGDTFYHQFHVLASKGMWVMYTNPRGSGGYGHDFAYITREKWGIDDYDDLMRFTDYAIKNYKVDPARLGVAGGSYGGFMTNWITTQTTRFKAAAASRTIVDWMTFFGTSDASGLIVNEFGFGLPFDKKVRKTMDDLSPLNHVQNVTTPTLLIQSEDDWRTPMNAAEEWYRAMKVLNVDTRFVRYPRENHELSRSGEPKHLIHRLKEIRNWFEHYLVEEGK